MDSVKVSIVVPVYNIPEPILRKCIESTINQTLHEIEVILVDDGSTDNSGAICDEYANIDSRITVIHKKNGGLSAARNSGYECARGEWLTFLDSDDWIDAHTCEDTYKLGVDNNADVVIFGTIQEFGNYKNPFTYNYSDGQIFTDNACKELQLEILNFTGNIATAWAKLIRKELLDNCKIEHNEILKQGSEGIEFNIRLFEYVRSAFFTDKIYYHYVFNPDSISAKHDEKNHKFVIGCFEEIERQLMKFKKSRIYFDKLFLRFSYVVVATAVSGYFSPLNKQKYSEKKKAFCQYLDAPFVKKALNNTEIRKLDFQRRIILIFISMRIFIILPMLGFLRYKKKHT